MDVEDERSRRVRDVGRVRAAAGELPDGPGVDRAADELAGLGTLLRTSDLIEDPTDLGPGEVRVDHQAGALAHQLLVTVGAQSLADGRACPALPDDGGIDRTARRTLPHDGRLALVRNADRGDLGRTESRTREGFAPDRDGRRENFLGIVLDVSRRGIELSYLAVGASADGAGLVENDRARARRPLIEREDRGHSVLKRRMGSTSRR